MWRRERAMLSDTVEKSEIHPYVKYSTFFRANATERIQSNQNWSRIGKTSQSHANADQMSRIGLHVNCANGGPMLELFTNAL